MLSSAKARRVSLSPKPGFVVKTRSEKAGNYVPASSPNTALSVPLGFKVFLNICYDDAVPQPPAASDAEIHRAMEGEDLDREGTYFVPLVVGDGREVKDRAGNPSLVFDAVFHPIVKSRASNDQDYKTYITELALERVEERSGLTLGRELSIPNIAVKGTLDPRTVLIPDYWFRSSDKGKSKPLVEEITSPPPSKNAPPSTETPTWKITRDEQHVSIIVNVPKLTRANHATATLDIESNRLILQIPDTYSLDIPLVISPTPKAGQVNGRVQLDVNDTKAEWRVSEGKLVVRARVAT